MSWAPRASWLALWLDARAVEQPYEEAFAPVYSALGSIVAINLAIVLAVVLGGFRIAVSIVRPIEALFDRRQADQRRVNATS